MVAIEQEVVAVEEAGERQRRDQVMGRCLFELVGDADCRRLLRSWPPAFSSFDFRRRPPSVPSTHLSLWPRRPSSISKGLGFVVWLACAVVCSDCKRQLATPWRTKVLICPTRSCDSAIARPQDDA